MNEILYDKNGRQIFPGDLLKTFHFKHAQRSKGNAYLYHVATVANGLLMATDVSWLHEADKGGHGQCQVKHMGQTEIIYGYGDGQNYWRDRPKRKGEDFPV